MYDELPVLVGKPAYQIEEPPPTSRSGSALHALLRCRGHRHHQVTASRQGNANSQEREATAADGPPGERPREPPLAHRYGFKINEGTGGGMRGVRPCLHAGCGGRGARPAGGADRWRAGRGTRWGRGGAARQSASGPRPRGRGVRALVRRVGVCSRACRGGGEPRAARGGGARARSAPPVRATPAPRRARSLPLRPQPPPRPRPPRLRPVFVWARQREGTLHEVRCEDYDERNRIRIARTPHGWRVIPRTEIYNSIRVPPPPEPEPPGRRDRRRRRRTSKYKRRRSSPAWPPPGPDLESHIPSHTIAVATPAPAAAAPEPTPLDNLLAVAELELSQQRGSELLALEAGARYGFLPDEEAAHEAMAFELAEPKPPDEMYYEGEAPRAPHRTDEAAFPSELSAHKDLFDTISEAHYLPELGGPHDEELLESLVEKGCEDNQILALDKLTQLVHGAPDYPEEDDDILLGGAPVADIIDRLEQSLESPGRSSMTAAQGLLHLHHIADHLQQSDHRPQLDDTYMPDQMFTQRASAECAMAVLDSHTENERVSHVEYDCSADKRLEADMEASNVMYTDPVPDAHESYEEKQFEDHSTPTLPDQSEGSAPCEAPTDETECEQICDSEVKLEEPQEIQYQEEHAVDEMEIKEEVEDVNKSPESLEPTDLSMKHVDDVVPIISSLAETTEVLETTVTEKVDEQPKDLSVPRRLPTPHASPRRTEVPRAPSRESDAMQSPQPSGIPAVPSSPEIFTMPLTKSKQTLFLETLLSSPSPKMYTSEVTITKQQCEPLNLGKHRKSASPTVSSCSDEMRKLNKEFGEPQEKRIRRESADDLVKISKVFNKCSEDSSDPKHKKSEKSSHKSRDDGYGPLKQLHALKTSPEFNIPDPLLVPKDKLNDLLENPGREIPALLIQRPELRLPEAFAYPAILQDPNILVISLSQLETILENDAKKHTHSTPKETKSAPPIVRSTASSLEQSSTPQPQAEATTTSSQPKPIPSMDALAGDIDAATSAALNQMIWLPYLSQLEAMAACSQNADFLKALNSSGYNGPNYPDLSQMFNPAARFMGQPGFPMMPPMDYDNRLQFSMWQEAMSHANAAASQQQRPKPSPLETQMKELASKTGDVQNPYVHSTKNHHSKPHSSARTSPIAHNYNNSQRSMNHNPFLQGMYPGMGPNVRPNVPLPGLQIPYFNPNLMGSQRSPRTGQQKSPTSPYYNNNYLHSVKQSEGQHSRSGSASSQESPRPRISVKSLQNLLEPSTAGSSRRGSHPPAASLGRRREEPEVGSTTPLGEHPTHHLPPHPHDPASFHLWHPLFGK